MNICVVFADVQVGEELRQFHQSQKGFRKTQVEKFLVDQHRKVEDSHHQMASALRVDGGARGGSGRDRAELRRRVHWEIGRDQRSSCACA